MSAVVVVFAAVFAARGVWLAVVAARHRAHHHQPEGLSIPQQRKHPMKRIITMVAALVVLTLGVAAAGANEDWVPVDQEPAPLAVDQAQPIIVVEVPTACAPGAPAGTQCVQVWACPAGLSAGAQQRAEVPYSLAQVFNAASRSSHCLLSHIGVTAPPIEFTG